MDEIKNNNYNLNVPRYVDTSEPEKEIDVQATINELMNQDKVNEEFELKVKQDIKEVGFRV